MSKLSGILKAIVHDGIKIGSGIMPFGAPLLTLGKRINREMILSISR